MKISSYQAPMVSKCPQFRASFPVVHWVAETNGSYAPVANLEIIKTIQGKIIRILNKPLKDSTKPMNTLEQRLRAYLGRCDAGYRTIPQVRSFYNKEEAYPDRFTPISYIITGKDVDIFNNSFAKDIGRVKAGTDELDKSRVMKSYNRDGLRFVKSPERQIRDSGNMMYVLHTKFEIVRNKLGKIKDYRFVEARFLPIQEQENKLGKM